MTQSRMIRAQTQADAAEERTFLGQSYLVVPVVAMIEGVRFGGNQDEPELGLASDFGKYPVAWNNKPLVVNHPQVGGVFVSANTVDVLETSSFGFTANAHVADGKLKMEAWIALTRADAVPEVQAFIDQINAQEMIEVSVGFFSDVEEKSGSFKGQSYGGVWRNIVPDHLAFLTDQPGACSIADGCGVPRINHSQEAKMTLKTDGAKVQDCECGCGGKDPEACENAQVTAQTAENSTATSVPAEDSSVVKVREIPADVVEVKANVVAENIASSSIADLVGKALKAKATAEWGTCTFDCYMVSFTAGETSRCIFEIWTNEGYVMKSIEFDLSDDGEVTFTGEPKDVRIVSHVYESDSKETDMSTKTQTSSNEETVQVPTTVTPAAQSLEDAMKTLSASDRQQVEAGLAVLQKQKDDAVNLLVNSGKCAFDADFLKTQSQEFLDKMVESMGIALGEAHEEPAEPAAPTAQTAASQDDFSGRAAPVAPQVQASSGADDLYMPVPSLDA